MYVFPKIQAVEGWLDAMDADFTERLLSHLPKISSIGPVAELGVHKGKYLSLIHGATSEWGVRTLGIDGLFDANGAPLPAEFQKTAMADIFKNLTLASSITDRVIIHGANTHDITKEKLADLAGAPLAFVSIDGGHDAETVCHDLSIVMPNLVSGGIAAIDDVFNVKVPGVVEGVCRFLSLNEFAPFAICGNKTFITTKSHHQKWLDFVRSLLADPEPYLQSSKSLFERQIKWRAVQKFFGYEIATFIP